MANNAPDIGVNEVKNEEKKRKEKQNVRIHRKMIERMEKSYTDATYINEEVIDEFQGSSNQGKSKTPTRKVNYRAATLVVKCASKLFDIVLNFGAKVLKDHEKKSNTPISTDTIKNLFVHVRIHLLNIDI